MDNPEMRSRMRTTFDEDPTLYDRTRPVCPESLFDDLVATARFSAGARLVEIGCGTGQATLPLARRGFAIVAIELGERLAAFARQKLAGFPNVEIINVPFGQWDASDARFDGVIAVHSFHYTEDDYISLLSTTSWHHALAE